MTDTATIPAPGSASQTVATIAPASASPTAQAPATPAPIIAPSASASQEGADKITKEIERLQRLLKEQQDKSKELETAAQEAAAMRGALRQREIQDHLRDAGVARPDLMAKLFDVQTNHFGADQRLNPDGRKALEAFVSSLGDELRSRKTASTPAPANGAPAAPPEPPADTKTGTGFMRRLWAIDEQKGASHGK